MRAALATRRTGGRKRWWLVSLASLLAVGSEPTSGQQSRGGPPPVSLGDSRLEPLRTAAARWEARQGPDRQVIDQVCLVPDVATFFEAIGRWDRGHFFPVLIEDAESTPRFLRAFQPARVVRLPRTADPIPPGGIWAAAVSSVRTSWRAVGVAPVPGSGATIARPPESLGPTPPGLVLSNPNAAMLPGAVALAAGHFQPLVRFDSGKEYGQTLTHNEFRDFNRGVTAAVATVAPHHLGLGDDCDFLTIAGNYPYRYRDAKGEDEAVDDALARDEVGLRWAYAGRILGDPAASASRAMGALFLQPDSITLFNGYDDSALPWSDYSTRGASLRFSARLNSTQRGGARDGSVAGWHEAFDPENRAGLVWINSHGTPTAFNLQGGAASTTDVPRTVPCSVVMVHSFSAADPTNPATIAGRWLANGAFTYFGSINEPFLQAFRTPGLVADLLSEHLPLVAALRTTSVEPFGSPWRLEYLGDPLFRIKPRRPGVLRNRSDPGMPSPPSTAAGPGRVSPPQLPADWVVVVAEEPTAASSVEATFRAAVDAALVVASRARPTSTDPAVAATITRLTDIDRARLAAGSRRTYDLILADLMFFAQRRAELRIRLEAIPPGERSPELGRWLDTIRAVDFAWVLAGGDFSRIITAWSRIVGSAAPTEYQKQVTAQVGALANDPERRVEWLAALRASIGDRPLPAGSEYLKSELDRVEAVRRQDRRPGQPTGEHR